MTAQEAKEKATNNFKSGMSCAQAVATVFAEEFGFPPEQIAAFVQAFGGGMCRMREVCGSVSGMLFSLGMYNSKSETKTGASGDEKSRKDKTYATGQKLMDEFKKINGSIVCRELLGLAPKQSDSPTSSPRSEEYYKKRPCAELCGTAAEIFQKFLTSENQISKDRI